MLERMADFFENRLIGYDEHMLTAIESANEFYPFTAKMLPAVENCCILDLGCGTGLELEEYYLLSRTRYEHAPPDNVAFRRFLICPPRNTHVLFRRPRQKSLENHLLSGAKQF